MAKRYAVLNADGLVVNHILIGDPLPAKYWPGYGAALVPLEEADVSAGCALDVYVLKIKDIPQIGDTLDVNTGELTKFVPVIASDGGSSAPMPKFVQEADPKTAKEVTVAKEIEVKVGK